MSKNIELVIYGRKVLVGSEFSEMSIGISSDKIVSLLPGRHLVEGAEFIDAGDSCVMPGFIDTHVHINEPGRTDWEGFETATKSAARGGITSLVDMPLNSSPVTIHPRAFSEKRSATENKLYVNCGFWGGIVPENAADLMPLIEEGVLGIKAFLTHSGIDEFPNVTEEDLIKAIPALLKSGIPLLAHAELDAENPDAYLLENSPTSYRAYLRSRPRIWEDKAIEMLLRLCAEYKFRMHIVHLSSSNSIDALRKAKMAGLPVSVETCPQYLYFAAEDIPDGDTRFKCAPPIRERENNELLWKALEEGVIDFIVSDHSPAPPALKQIESGNLKKAWGGISSLQFSVSVVWTAAKKRGYSLQDLSKWMSSGPAALVSWQNSKGKIEIGFDADLVIWNPEEEFIVKAENIEHRHKITPYENEKLFGKIITTLVGGIPAYHQGSFTSKTNGKILLNKKNANN